MILNVLFSDHETFTNEAMTMKQFYDKEEDAKDADTPEHSLWVFFEFKYGPIT